MAWSLPVLTEGRWGPPASGLGAQVHPGRRIIAPGKPREASSHPKVDGLLLLQLL